jgi:hypothetical protein
MIHKWFMGLGTIYTARDTSGKSRVMDGLGAASMLG